MNFLQRNLFTKLRADNFGIKEEMEPMTTFKKKKIAQMLKNVNDVPAGEVKMNNGFLNRRLSKIQEDERHAIDTSIETIYLLRIIVANVNGMLANGINLRGIIQLGDYLRRSGLPSSASSASPSWKEACSSPSSISNRTKSRSFIT